MSVHYGLPHMLTRGYISKIKSIEMQQPGKIWPKECKYIVCTDVIGEPMEDFYVGTYVVMFA